MYLTHKQRMSRALCYKPVDRIPTQINYTDGMADKMGRHFGVSKGELPAFLGNHMIRVDLDHPHVTNASGSVRYDWWGVGWDTAEEGYFAKENPLAEIDDIESYAWPDPSEPGLLQSAKRTIQEQGDEYFITPNFGFALFERAWAMRGFEQFFVDMAMDPEYTSALLDKITHIQLTLIQRFLDAGVDGAYFGDDYGAQKNLLFSPRMWDRYMKPRLDRMFKPFRELGMPILMHSDGQIQRVLPGLKEIGLTALNPVQPEVLDHHWLASEFGGNLAFYGGVSTQTVLPNGSASDVSQAVNDVVAALAPEGTGLVIAPSHRMMTDIPMHNVEALLEAFRSV